MYIPAFIGATLALVHLSSQCARTVPGDTATTPPTSVTTVAPGTGCKSCTDATPTIIAESVGTKPFTSMTIDPSGTCSIYHFVCDGNEPGDAVIISYNRDAAGTDQGNDKLVSDLLCNDQGQWTKSNIVITEIECQST
ncbi:unnamed protein product [Caenorhabditis auriculariae]|uniref:C6 domain-containing protein n=1 Tax=Caenorhabditis auriculariae TaxID=2777116 RepID=A0A8S1GX11_9PELO|nr:unnamed protein product [Caenorhabditis auriculariae]